MYQKILVAMDMSEMGQEVFNKGLFIAQGNHAHLTLLHVLSGEEENSPLPVPSNLREIYPAVGNDLTLESWQEQWKAFEQTGINTLESRQEQATQMGVQCHYRQVAGTPGKTICKMAKEENADLIVVGHRGRSGLQELLLGSVSNYVLHHAPCSVLIVNQKCQEEKISDKTIS